MTSPPGAGEAAANSHPDDQERLTGGNATPGGVLRIGDTVRKCWLPTTEKAAGYLRALRERGIDVPLVRGRDEAGRQVLDFIPGRLALRDSPLDLGVIRRAGALVRSIHDASAELPVPTDWPVLIPASKPSLLCHNDLATWNLIINGDRMVFIDWDGAGPSSALWDLAYAAISFGHLFPDASPSEAAERLSAFVDGYGADAAMRSELPGALVERAAAMYELLRRSNECGIEPWSSMFTDFHGKHWSQTTAYLAEHANWWRLALLD